VERDVELVRRAQGGERAAFDELVRLHLPRMQRIARSFALLWEDAQDLCQEAFVSAYSHLDELRDPARFGEWLAAILRNLGRSWQRRQRVQPSLLSLEAEGAEAEIDRAALAAAADSREQSEVRQMVADVLAASSPEQRDLLRLHYLHGYDYQETAALLRLPIPAVRGRLHRARTALRKEFAQMTPISLEERTLDAWDLEALRLAAGFASAKADSEQRPLTALALGEGRIVATDSYRLFCCQSPALADLPQVLVHADLGRQLARTPSQSRGRLRFTEREAIVRFETGEEVRAPLVFETYPNYARLLACTWTLRLAAQAEHWRRACEVLTHAVSLAPREGAEWVERIVMVISPAEGRITLRAGVGLEPEAGLLCETSLSFPARALEGEAEVTMAANVRFIAEALRAVQLLPHEEVELGVSHALGPFLFRPLGSDRVLAITMPMQLPSAVAEAAAAAGGARRNGLGSHISDPRVEADVISGRRGLLVG
jgi:RNA polymerase sigma-70 factor (ECF subfamily)